MKLVFNFYQFLYRLSIVFILEYYKTKLGQPCTILILNFWFYLFLIFIITSTSSSSFLFFIVLSYLAIETLSYYFINTPITYQVLTTFSIKFVYETHPIYFLYIFVLALVLYAISSINWYSQIIKFDIPMFSVLFVFMVLLFKFILTFLNNLVGDHNKIMINGHNNELFYKLNRMLYEGITIKKPKKMKNIILFQIESLESYCINNQSMPYLYSLSKQYSYFDNITSTMYSGWSAAGTLLTQCGVPQIITNMRWNSFNKQSIDRYNKLNCLSDYLLKIGYIPISYSSSGMGLQGMDFFRKSKHYKVKFTTSNDIKLFKKVKTDIFLSYKNYTKKRYLFWILNEDTHFPYRPRRWCKPKNLDQDLAAQQHNCMDQLFEEALQPFFDLKLFNDCVIVIYSDHLMMGKITYPIRKLFLLFPGLERESKTSKVMTYYDFIPTVFDALGIKDYQPGFPFGVSGFSKKVGGRPSYSDYTTFFNFFNENMNVYSGSRLFKCGNKTSYYICNQTL